MKYNEVASASAFTLFVNNGGLRVPSQSVYSVVEYTEKVFKANVCQQGQKITTGSKLKQKMVVATELYLYIWRLRSYTFASQKVKPKTWRPRDVKRVIDITVYLFSGNSPLTTTSDRDFKVFIPLLFSDLNDKFNI